ncbi:hypothetical protein Pla52o_58190 [Novipirellula galeiformis]|uniref:Uncharacterized protein n=2 Tax=Novipirellula galeiformis TaxID=2528004 RepID=A0A5C6BHG7_9BACT|nr:hypothetical protein Pla52o_58190 [Novipirellula galeiformis]
MELTFLEHANVSVNDDGHGDGFFRVRGLGRMITWQNDFQDRGGLVLNHFANSQCSKLVCVGVMFAVLAE